MKQVYATTSLPEAQALCAMLKANGVEAVVENEGAAFYAVGMPSPALPLCLSVPDGQAEEAARLLAEHRTSEPQTAEDAAFAERVRRSGEASRRKWRLYLWLAFGLPLLIVGPVMAVVEGNAENLLPWLAVGAALFGVPLAVAFAARQRRRSPGAQEPPRPGT